MSRHRPEALRSLMDAMRENAGRGLALHQAIADRFGLGPTDLKCLDLARHEPELTAGRLAESTGLSTSAVTALIDRLERGGFVERHRDPLDRRRVLIRSTGRHEAALREIFSRIEAEFLAVVDGYDDGQLEMLTEFVGRLNARAREVTTLLTGRPDR
ncbi:MarR family winged helix-turn-helix transcriptional regulator [Microbispora triticiradicis]|uniref:MarR family winged helix-turn-helix transcriptional regulator n=1 Tax=Microbispora triticiradicis TaxID=2200763 RepID=UPI001AD64473|nr:MarR family transcriptional regulator [Microbispora triticiradicis]MBO4272035.1 MarR family transcriptional regulator [Microbispora triticiradicis]